MAWVQKEVILTPKSRGVHLITSEILSQVTELSSIKIGLMNIFIKHTSASLIINENADPDVRHDMELALNHIVPEQLDYRHTMEGSDDMPAHVKSSLMGASLNVPIKDGRLNLGTWQGIYLGEHRNNGGKRHLVITIQGELS